MARFDTGILRMELISQDYDEMSGYTGDYKVNLNCGKCGLNGQMEIQWPPEGYTGEPAKHPLTLGEKAWVYVGEIAMFSCSHVEKRPRS